MFESTIFIKNIDNYKFNFKKILLKSNAILINNCDNVNIIIKSKISKIIIQNCQNIKINVSSIISGIEIVKSKDINIKIYKNKKINCLELFNSNVKINNLNYILYNENSNIKLLN